MATEQTFANIPLEYALLEQSKAILIPVPYDKTSTWGKGAAKGPEAFLEAAKNMELYDIETGLEVYKEGIFLAPFLQVEQSPPEEMVIKVYQEVKKYLTMKKFITLIGGEHSISIGVIRAFRESFPHLSILQLDAHTDLRPTYENSSYNHACALYEASKHHQLIQVGIRSMDISEKEHIQKGNVFYAEQIIHQNNNSWVEKAIASLKDDMVFITIDLDVLDPSIFPSTGTPEPGGLGWYEMLYFLRRVFKEKKVVGFDMVELAPNKNDRSSDFLAAKLYYKLLTYALVYNRL